MALHFSVLVHDGVGAAHGVGPGREVEVGPGAGVVHALPEVGVPLVWDQELLGGAGAGREGLVALPIARPEHVTLAASALPPLQGRVQLEGLAVPARSLGPELKTLAGGLVIID